MLCLLICNNIFNDKMNNIYNNVEPYYKKDKPYLTRDLLVQLKELYEKLLIKDI